MPLRAFSTSGLRQLRSVGGGTRTHNGVHQVGRLAFDGFNAGLCYLGPLSLQFVALEAGLQALDFIAPIKIAPHIGAKHQPAVSKAAR